MYLYIFHNQDNFISDEIYLNASERKLHGILKAYQNKAMVEDNPVGHCNWVGTNNSPRKCNLYTSFQLNSNTTSRTKVDVNAASKLYLI